MKPTRKTATPELPRGSVRYMHRTIMPDQLSDSFTQEGEYPVAVIPCHTRKEAAAVVKLHSMPPRLTLTEILTALGLNQK